VNATGTITTVAGTGTAGLGGDGAPATSANLDEVTDMVVDSAGNVYLAERYRIREVHLGG